MTSSSENENHITVIQESEKNQNEEISTINEQDERYEEYSFNFKSIIFYF